MNEQTAELVAYRKPEDDGTETEVDVLDSVSDENRAGLIEAVNEICEAGAATDLYVRIDGRFSKSRRVNVGYLSHSANGSARVTLTDELLSNLGASLPEELRPPRGDNAVDLVVFKDKGEDDRELSEHLEVIDWEGSYQPRVDSITNVQAEALRDFLRDQVTVKGPQE